MNIEHWKSTVLNYYPATPKILFGCSIWTKVFYTKHKICFWKRNVFNDSDSRTQHPLKIICKFNTIPDICTTCIPMHKTSYVCDVLFKKQQFFHEHFKPLDFNHFDTICIWQWKHYQQMMEFVCLFFSSLYWVQYSERNLSITLFLHIYRVQLKT